MNAGPPMGPAARLALSLYSLLVWALQPLLRRKLARRGRREPGYAEAVEERFGNYAAQPTAQTKGQGWIWLHAVSLGETQVAAILLPALRQQLPGMRLLLTHGTATGRAAGQALLQPGDLQLWQPWDTPRAARRFLQHFQPAIGVLIETEVWPNLAAQCRRQRIPLVLANARLNPRSLRQAQRLAWLARPAYKGLAAVWAQTQADAERLAQLSGTAPAVLGNIKFDATPNARQQAQGQAWRAAQTRPVIILASAREGEEAALLEIIKHLRPLAHIHKGMVAIHSEKSTEAEAAHTAAPDSPAQAASAVQWLIVPRHPQRFDAVAELVQASGLSLSRRSHWDASGPPAAGADIWLGDSLGEMALYYSLSRVALLGGSFAPLGGQNLIEAAACGCPLLIGPSVFNFQQAASLAQQAGAAWPAANLADAAARAVALATNPAAQAQAQAAALQFASAHRGAAQRTALALAGVLQAAGA